MISAEHAGLMAEYGQWMNTRLYELCSNIEDAERRKERGAFFGSIHGTLNHLVYADLAFLSRFTGDPSTPPPLGVDLYRSFAELRAAREALDHRIVDWVQGFTEAWLARVLTYTSNVDGKTRCVPHWVVVTHMFNHATHHRGQLTTLLSQMGLDVGTTDIPFMPRFTPAESGG